MTAEQVRRRYLILLGLRWLPAGLLHRQAAGEHRTSLLSLNSMAGQAGFAIGSMVLTAMAAQAGSGVAIVAGATVLAMAAPLYLVKPREGPSGMEFRETSPSGTSLSQAL